MEIDQLLSHTQYALLPVAVVMVLAVLVFTFGFRSVTEPEFVRGSGDEKKTKKQPRAKETKVN